MEPSLDPSVRVHYDLQLRVDPAAQWLDVHGSLVVHASEAWQDHVRFYLHHQLEIQSLGGRRVSGYHFEKWPVEPPGPEFPSAGMLDVYFDPPLAQGSAAMVEFHYNGQVNVWPEDSPHLISPAWTELGRGLPWFPLLYDNIQHAQITYTLQIEPLDGYTLASPGKVSTYQGRLYYQTTQPTTDILVAAGKTLRSLAVENETSQVWLYSATLADSTAKLLADDLLWVLDRYAGWLGPLHPCEYTLILSPRVFGGNYARRAVSVLNALSDREYLDQRETTLHTLAHEIARIWFSNLPTRTREDWLIESFAEYSALLALRERFGEEALARLLDHKRRQAVELPALWTENHANTPAADAQLHHQGPLLLHHLATRIGSRRFFDLCRAMLWSDVRSTPHLLDLVAEIEDTATREWLSAILRGEEHL